MKRRLLHTSAAVAAVLSISAPVSAAVVVDQSNPTNVGAFSFLNNGVTAQSFVAGMSNSVGAGIFLSTAYNGDPGPVTLSLWTGKPFDGASMMLASGSALGAMGQWADASWGQVGLTVGNTYNLQATSGKSLVSSFGGSYTGGNAYYSYGGEYPTYDLTFRTFAESDSVGAVPEPATWAMMLLGFGAIGFGLRRRRAAPKVSYNFA